MNNLIRFGRKYLPSFLTGAGVICLLATGYFGYKAGKEVQLSKEMFKEADLWPDDKLEQFKLTWRSYLPLILVGGAGVACIIGSQAMNLSKQAALASAITLWRGNYEELENKIREKFGDGAANDIKQEIINNRVKKSPPPKELLDSKDDKMLCYEPYSKQYFRASKEQLLWAELTANKIFQQQSRVMLNDILRLFPDCKPCPLGEEIGWFMDSDTWSWNWSFYGTPWVDIKPQIGTQDGNDVLFIEYGMHPDQAYEDDYPMTGG